MRVTLQCTNRLWGGESGGHLRRCLARLEVVVVSIRVNREGRVIVGQVLTLLKAVRIVES